LELRPESVPFKILEIGKSQFFPDARLEALLAKPRDDGEPRFIERERVVSCAILVLRPPEKLERTGLIFVNFRKRHCFSLEEKRVMSAIAVTAASAIRTARLHKADLAKVIDAMHAVHTAIVEKGPNLTPVFEVLLKKMLDLTGAQYGVFMRYNRNADLLQEQARIGMPSHLVITPQKIGEGIIGLAARTEKSILVEDVEDKTKSFFVEGLGEVNLSSGYKRVNSDTRCELAIPLVEEPHRLWGVLNIEHTKPGGINEDDKRLLDRFAIPAIIAIHGVDLYYRLQRQIGPVQALSLIAARIQDPQYDIDTILRLLLTGVTANEGLRFSRAILFSKIPGKVSSLRTMVTVGPNTQGEADSTWRPMETKRPDFNSLLDAAKQFSEDLRAGRAENTPLAKALNGHEVDLVEGGALARCINLRERVQVDDGKDDPARFEPGRLFALDRAFLCLPLLGRTGDTLGVLLLDNRFLPNEREIDPATIPIAETIAHMAAMTIENDRLRADAELKSRYAAWKDVAFNAAHRLGNPVDAVDNFLVTLTTKIKEGKDEEALRISTYIDNSVEEAKKVIDRMKSLSREQEISPRPAELMPLINTACKVAQLQGVHVQFGEVMDPRLVMIDPERMVECLNELVANSLHWMDKPDKKITVCIEKIENDRLPDTLDKNREYLRVTFGDNGCGVPLENKNEIFAPLFTTRYPDGAGIGLYHVQRVVEGCGGSVSEVGEPGARGALFEIYLPVAADRRD
jgi:signal transduction histidine kinase/putative methionine-R-sulfoxide reductase with GAF domain